MITIDALLKTGESALTDLDGCSPTGGQVTTANVARDAVRPGDVVRECGAWAVVAGTATNGVLGVTTLALILADGTAARRTLTCSDCVNARTDCRIDPDTLWRLADTTRSHMLAAMDAEGQAALDEYAEAHGDAFATA